MPARKPKKPGRIGFQPSLRDLRVLKWPPVSVTQAARALNISQAHLSNVERANQPAGPRLLFEMAVYYGLSRDEILAAYRETQRRLAAREDDPQAELQILPNRRPKK